MIPFVFPALFYLFQCAGLLLIVIALSIRCHVLGWIGAASLLVATLLRIAEHGLGFLAKYVKCCHTKGEKEFEDDQEIDVCTLHPILIKWLLKREKKERPSEAISPTISDDNHPTPEDIESSE